MKKQGLFTVSLGLIFLLCACQKGTKLEVIDFHTEVQYDYLNTFVEDISYYANGTLENSKPVGYRIEFNNPNNSLYTIKLSSDIDNRSFRSKESYFTFNNLYLDTEYHYSIERDDKVITKGGFITNTLAPRNLDVDGVTNFRDLGGHLTNSETRTKQGKMYRSAKFSENGSSTALITSIGKETIVKDLHIKSEIDLRLISNNETGGIKESVISSSLNYFSIPMTFDGDVFIENEAELKHLFDIISDESNYPCVFHCSIGTDRTGFVAMILNSLLDVTKEEIYRDYLFSNFAEIGGSRNLNDITKYETYLSLYEGFSLKEQAIDYLSSIGVENTKIQQFISIMSE